MKAITRFALVVITLGAILTIYSSIYVVDETEQVIITAFGKPVGDPISEAGLKFKIPFVQKANRIEKRILEWDGIINEMPTKEKTYIRVDTFGRWKISDPKQYFLRLRDERSAISRLEDVLGGETRNAIAKHALIEVIRTTKDRILPTPELIPGDLNPLKKVEFIPITKGRSVIEQEIFAESKPKLETYGIELLDVRFKRINYNRDVSQDIYVRMISERKQIADRFRSEGEGEAARIKGKKEKDLKEIESTAYKEIQTVMGEADAKATEIYASAYNQTPEAAELYQFLKTMELYEEAVGPGTTIVLSTKSDLFRFMKGMRGVAPKPALAEKGRLPVSAARSRSV